MRLTERDIAIVIDVYKHRVLSSHQIEAKFFPSSKKGRHTRRSACQRRLQLLFHHGFLARIPQSIILGEGRSPIVYALDSAGADLVAAEIGVDRADLNWKPKDNGIGNLFLEHSLAINDMRVALTLLARQRGWKILNWIGDSTFKSKSFKDKVPFRMTGARVVRSYPDGYLRIRLNQEKLAHFFLEIDRGTMSNSRWQGKVEAYLNFRAAGLSEKHYNTQNFRVLTITTSQSRMVNLKRATEAATGDIFFWFSTNDNVSIWRPETLLQPVWHPATLANEAVALFS